MRVNMESYNHPVDTKSIIGLLLALWESTQSSNLF